MVSVILAGIFGIVGMGAGMLMIGPAVYIMKFFEWLCKLNKKINFAVYTAGRPEMFRIIAYYFLLIIIVYLVIEKKKWISEEEMLDIIAIAESTPGPRIVKLALPSI